MAHTFGPPAVRLPRKLIGRAARSLTLVALLALAGCASVPPPDGLLSQAQAQIQAARDAGAGDYAPVDLGFAQNKFQQAQAAMAAHRYDQATILAEEASADAMLAAVKARLAAARAQLQAKQAENARLREENAQARREAEQHAAQLRAALAGPAPAGAASALPPPEPLPDLPAPPSSVLDAAPPAPSASSPSAQPLPGDQP